MLQTAAPDWQLHGGPPNLPSGPAGLCVLAAHLQDVTQTWTVEDVIAAGDRVVLRATNRCEQPSFLGVPAAGVQQVFTATFTFLICDGMVHRDLAERRRPRPLVAARGPDRRARRRS